MSRFGNAFGRVTAWIFPSRASTQRWMVLTFVLFVGIAVVSVSLYVTLIVRSEVEATLRHSLMRQALLIAEELEREPDSDRRRERVAAVARLTASRVTIIDSTGVIVDEGPAGPVDKAEAGTHPEIRALDIAVSGFARRSEGGQTTWFAAVRREGSGLIVRVGTTEPALFALTERLRNTVIVAMLLALFLSVIGSWIAARRITEPLETIRDSARRVSEGHFNQAITIDSRAAEFQDLASSLNRMSDAFREKIVHLQRLAALQNEFLGNVSHEVRNPIFAVGGYLEALSSSTLTAEQRRFYAEKGLANLERLNNLFNDLIEIARLEYREDMIKPADFDLQELVEEISDMLRSKAEDKRLELITDNPGVVVRADRNRIRQVLVNLIDNAIAYSDEGTVRCRFRRHLNKVRIEVVDTGRGIPEEHLEKVFERFYRVDPDRSRKSGGTGLGLSIVRQILHAHGETIHVESTVGRSTRFWFELPLAGSAASA